MTGSKQDNLIQCVDKYYHQKKQHLNKNYNNMAVM